MKEISELMENAAIMMIETIVFAMGATGRDSVSADELRMLAREMKR